jgi:glycosyltransferase involved in cell wall biosynthesis
MTPTVSVIIPNYRHARYLRQRIDSVLEQSYSDFELILLDDASPDDSREILNSYSSNPHVTHIVLNEENSGSTFAQWQRGLALAQGRYVWIAESDDCADKEFLATLVPLLEANPAAAMAFTGSHMVDAEGKEIEGMDWDEYRRGAPEVEVYTGEELVRRKFLWTAYVYNASMVLFRRAMAPEITAHQLRMHYCGDWLFWVNMAQNGGAVEVRRKLNYFRQHQVKVSTAASKSGLYFVEGLPIMNKVADFLQLSDSQRKMLAGRTLKRLRKFPEFYAQHGAEVMAMIDRLSPGASKHVVRRELWYELDKYINFTGLQR